MTCMVCKQHDARVHWTQIVDGQLKKVDLCEACAKAKGVDDPTGAGLTKLLLELGASQEAAQATGGGAELTCPACGFTQADFKKSGRLGCPECYSTFAAGLESLLKTMHKGVRHIGKVPRTATQRRDLEDKITTLQARLDRAVTAENFEEAARLRDEIKTLREGFSGVLTA